MNNLLYDATCAEFMKCADKCACCVAETGKWKWAI